MGLQSLQCVLWWEIRKRRSCRVNKRRIWYWSCLVIGVFDRVFLPSQIFGWKNGPICQKCSCQSWIERLKGELFNQFTASINLKFIFILFLIIFFTKNSLIIINKIFFLLFLKNKIISLKNYLIFWMKFF